jgi:hypothetical protein
MVIADPGMGGHFWTPISPVRGSIFHADSQLEPIPAIIICSGLGFERKASIARSLLALRDDSGREAVSLINRIVTEAERNALIHSLVEVQPKRIELLKRQTDQKLKVQARTFDGTAMSAKTTSLQTRLVELKALLGISNQDLLDYAKTTRSLTSS